MTTALVTGGAGFIGSNLVRTLLDHNLTVRVFDNFSTGSRANLAGLEVDITKGDIREGEQIEAVVKGVDLVFHLAAMVSVEESMADPVGAYQANLIGSLNVLEACRSADVAQVVLSSSCAVYGNTSGPVSESAELQPLSPYAASKAAMERVAALYMTVYGLSTVCLRYFNVYGPRQRPDSDYAAVIPIFISRMAAGEPVRIDGDGQQTRDFVFVEDVARANWLAATVEGASGVYNVGSGRSQSILDLAEDLQQIFPQAPAPAHGPARAGDIRYSEANLSRASALGYHPHTALAAGLSATVEWFESHPNTRE
ncbi:MAG: NAD-dependent epimerase/dehydratase family protein [Anaerolineales bacterium]